MRRFVFLVIFKQANNNIARACSQLAFTARCRGRNAFSARVSICEKHLRRQYRARDIARCGANGNLVCVTFFKSNATRTSFDRHLLRYDYSVKDCVARRSRQSNAFARKQVRKIKFSRHYANANRAHTGHAGYVNITRRNGNGYLPCRSVLQSYISRRHGDFSKIRNGRITLNIARRKRYIHAFKRQLF